MKSLLGITVNPGDWKSYARVPTQEQSKQDLGQIEKFSQAAHRSINKGQKHHWHKRITHKLWPNAIWIISYSDTEENTIKQDIIKSPGPHKVEEYVHAQGMLMVERTSKLLDCSWTWGKNINSLSFNNSPQVICTSNSKGGKYNWLMRSV